MKKESQKIKEISKKRHKNIYKRKKIDLSTLKEAYKKGLLKFDSEDIAEAILKEFKKGISK